MTVSGGVGGRFRAEETNGRRARLRDELLDEHVPLPIDTAVGELLLDELLAARRPPRHEGRPPRYGSLVSGEPFAHEHAPGDPVDVDAAGLDDSDLRRCADGRGSFVLSEVDRPRGLVCFRHTMEYEATAVNLVRATGVYVVQRNLGGVRCCGPEGVIHWDGDNWTFKPLAERYVGPLHQLAPMADAVVLRSLLELCVHWLSAGRVGATIVWHLGPAGSDPAPQPGPTAMVDASSAVQAPKLNFGQPEHHPAALALLGQIDRAVELGPSGELLRAGVALLPSRESQEVVPALGGTRHTSARRFSFDAPDAIVFVVSESGRVTVFADGGVEAQVREEDCRTGLPEDLLHANDHADRQTTVRCSRCRRLLLLDVEDVPGWRGVPKLLDCPVCSTAVAVSFYRATIRGVRKERLTGPLPVAGR